MLQLTQNSEDLAKAFGNLQASLRTYLRRRIADASLADDILQDIFVKALLNKRQIENLTGWLYAAARTTLVDYYRNQGVSMEELDENMSEQQAEDLQLHASLASCLQVFIQQLPDKYRDTLMATDLQGHSLRDLADQTGLSLSAIKSRAARGRSMLKDKVLDCCHVEIQDGLVTDYHRHAANKCGGKCG
ncbi:sigma-70 family RNA polymerase sigma factor [Undibacterium pigrum]|uniref:RNA polymerase sigma (SigZ) subunit n=1 Tax=Undibacterium pigrum TaxID=401470 RepID=A0A318IUP7_9BURK|nr:sigma-70 family RNA polymerase sigma factor [Undibacterium pigrum]PXX38743.1 RNA polymerase sigma (SigZ) subunit [Undibacterium pigrum]